MALNVTLANNQAAQLSQCAERLSRAVASLSAYRSAINTNWASPETQYINAAIDDELSRINQAIRLLRAVSADIKIEAARIRRQQDAAAAAAAKAAAAKAAAAKPAAKPASTASQKSAVANQDVIRLEKDVKKAKEKYTRLKKEWNDIKNKILVSGKEKDKAKEEYEKAWSEYLVLAKRLEDCRGGR